MYIIVSIIVIVVVVMWFIVIVPFIATILEWWLDTINMWQKRRRLIAEAPALLIELEYALSILLLHPDIKDIGLFSIQDTIRKAKGK